MKIKFIVVLSLIAMIISGKKVEFINSTNDLKIYNVDVLNSEEIVSENEQVEIEQKKVENAKSETIVVTENINMAVENEKSTEYTTTKESTIQEKVNTDVVKHQENEVQTVTKVLTPNDLEYWCVAGGLHHIAGDKSNEHGYYSSWNEANQAFENYTQGWASVQYKISQCSCGLFYFWAIE